MSASIDHARNTTISADEFLNRVRHGFRDADYAYEKTEWFKALKALEREAKTVPAPVPPPTHVRRAVRTVYFSAVTDFACQRFADLGSGYTALLSADLNLAVPGGKYWATDDQLRVLRSGGSLVGSWCDCSATPYHYAEKLYQDRRLDLATGQFESDAEYDELVANGVTFAIGNPANLTASRLEHAVRLSERGLLDAIGEVMNPDPTYSAQGVDIDSHCFYVDRDDNQGGYQPLAAFSTMPEPTRRACSIYTGGRMTAADWDLYAEWTRPF